MTGAAAKAASKSPIAESVSMKPRTVFGAIGLPATGPMRLAGSAVFGVAHPDARGGIARRLETLGDNQGNGLAKEADAVFGEHRLRAP